VMAAQGAVLAAVLGLVAGAVLAAGGAVGAALSGLPVVLTGVIAPIAAIALGMDGITRAARTLRPEVDSLRTAVANTFEREMLPVFEKLRVVFPVLESGLSAVAVSVSRFAGGLAGVVTSGRGLELLRGALSGVGVLLDRMLPGTQALLGALLGIAGTTQLYHLLGETVGGLAQRFADFLDRVRETGLLTASLEALRGVLFSVTDSFLALLAGAMEFFTAAAPGLRGFFDGLTAAFGRIDFAALGASFGQIFAAIGDGLARVPPETWQLLAGAVAYFADTVQRFVASGALEAMIVAFAGLVAGAGLLLDATTLLAKPFVDLATGLGLVTGSTEIAGHAISGFDDKLAGLDATATATTVQVPGRFQTMADGIGGVVGQLPGMIGYAFGYATTTMIESVAGGVLGVAGWFTRLPSMVAGPVGAMVGSVVGFFKQLPGQLSGLAADAVGRTVAIFQGLPGRLRSIGAQMYTIGVAMIQGLIDGVKAMAGRIAQAAVDVVLGAIRGARAALRSRSPSLEFRDIGLDVGRGMEGGILATVSRVVAAVRAMVDRLLSTADTGAWRAAGGQLAEQLARGVADGRAAMLRATGGLVAAEDGSFVPPSFYTAGKKPGDVAAALAGMEFVLDSRGGELIARLVRKQFALDGARA
ncbi:MAG: hypothetical protein ACRD0V_17730, partial [Acidimicrobiales bacterium]